MDTGVSARISPSRRLGIPSCSNEEPVYSSGSSATALGRGMYVGGMLKPECVGVESGLGGLFCCCAASVHWVVFRRYCTVLTCESVAYLGMTASDC